MQGHSDASDDELQGKLLGETARVSWAEIERLFASGRVLRVAGELDLIEVAMCFARDDAARVGIWTETGAVAQLDDDTASRWADGGDDALWSVVVRPWVLVQERC